jgi:hypothetical protein
VGACIAGAVAALAMSPAHATSAADMLDTRFARALVFVLIITKSAHLAKSPAIGPRP